jgi:hypothetical protein
MGGRHVFSDGAGGGKDALDVSGVRGVRGDLGGDVEDVLLAYALELQLTLEFKGVLVVVHRVSEANQDGTQDWVRAAVEL